MRRALGRLALVVLIVIAGAAAIALATGDGAEAQTDPPNFGFGNWVVRDTTVLRDETVMLRGNLSVLDGGNLTLVNSTLRFVNSVSGEHGALVARGSSISILDGSVMGSSRLNIQWTFEVTSDSRIVILDSAIEECGLSQFGVRPDWTVVSLYVATDDFLVENSSFTGGLVGLYLESTEPGPPVRNCTFENRYGLITYGTSVEDCTFNGQQIAGLVVWGGDRARISRCRFYSNFATCLHVGYEYFEPPALFTATAVIEDCEFVQSARGLNVNRRSVARVERCSFDGLELGCVVALSESDVEIHGGQYVNSSVAIDSARDTRVTWAVEGRSVVRGGNVTLSGQLSVVKDAVLDMAEIRNLTFHSRADNPLGISLYEGSLLSIVNGSIEVPEDTGTQYDPRPVTIYDDYAEGTLRLEGLDRIDLAFPVRVRRLECRNTTLPMGTWRVGTAELTDCELVDDPGGFRSLLEVDAGWSGHGSLLERCTLIGVPNSPDPTWLEVSEGEVVSRDFLYDLEVLLEDERVRFAASASDASVRAFWSVQARVHWQNQVPIAGASVDLSVVGGEGLTLTTDARGITEVRLVETELAEAREEVVTYLPLAFQVNVSGQEGLEVVDVVDRPLLVDIAVMDLERPTMVVDQGLAVVTNASVIQITGSVRDTHSGVSFMEASVLPADHTRVELDRVYGRFELEVNLSEGVQLLSLRLYDNVGNRKSVVVEIYYSTSVPSVSVTSPEPDTWLNTRLVHILGETEIGATVEVLGRSQVAENGTFRILVPLVEGSNLIIVNATNRAGNHNSTSVQLYLDTQPPALALTSPESSPLHTNRTPESIAGVAEEGADVYIGTVPIPVGPTGQFQANIRLQEGVKRVTVTAVDQAGNSVEVEVVFVLDSEPPPLVVVVGGVDGMKYTGDGLLRTSEGSLRIEVSTEEGANVTVDGARLDLDGGNGLVDLELSAGLNSIRIEAVDGHGNVQAYPAINVDVDRTPPVLTIDPAPPPATEEALLRLEGYTEDNVTLYVNGARLGVLSDGSFRKTFVLSEGMNTLEVVARDRYGQEAVVTLDVEMIPSEPPPVERPPSMIPLLLALTVAVLVVEALLVTWYDRRKRGSPESEDPPTPPTSRR